jgi:integrase
MTKLALTDRYLLALEKRPAKPGKRYVVWDTNTPHLGVSVTDRGTRTFIVVKRKLGSDRPYRFAIGKYPAVTLAYARKETPGILTLLASGKSPREARDEAKRAEARSRADTFTRAVEGFSAHEASRKLRTWRETEAILRRQFLGQVAKREQKAGERVTVWADGKQPVWRARPVADISRRDIIERLDEIRAKGGKHSARHALNAVRRLFNWCAEGERFGLEVSPAAMIRDKTIGISGKDLKRKRVLDDAELRQVWHAADAMGYPFGHLVQMLMLTGQRLSDIANARAEEISNGMLVIPAARFKSDMTHEVPLTPRAIDIITRLPKFREGYYLFTTSGGVRPISIGDMREHLERAINEERAKNGAGPIPHWVLHDVRRTVRTRLGDLSVDSYIAERVIGHTLPGLHGVYDQGLHRTQKRAALEAWENLLLSIVEPKASPPNVVQLKGRKAKAA